MNKIDDAKVDKGENWSFQIDNFKILNDVKYFFQKHIFSNKNYNFPI
jgi:hypothetical protein